MSLSVEYTLQKVKSLARRGKNEEAKNLLHQLLEKFPSNQRAKDALNKLSDKPVISPHPPQDQINKLIALYTSGSFEDVIHQTEELSRKFSHSCILFNILGAAYTGRGRAEDAIKAYTKALAIKPDFVDAMNNLAYALCNLKRYKEAISVYTEAIRIKPDYADAHNNLGNTLYDLKRYDEAVAVYTKALQLKPDNATAHVNLGNVHSTLKQYEKAIAAYTKAIQLRPDYADAYNNLGVVLKNLKRYNQALAAYEKAIDLKPSYCEAYNNLANALSEIKRYEEAISASKKAIDINPQFAEAYNNLGNLYKVLKRYDAAVSSYTRAAHINPSYAEPKAQSLYLLAHLCDWASLEAASKDIPKIGTSGASCFPFTLLSFEDSPQQNLKRSQLFAREKHTHSALTSFKQPSAKPSSLKIGYFSADFHNHATMFLMAKLFETHNKNKFSIFCYSFGPVTNDEMQNRVKGSAHIFRDVSAMSDKEVAELARKDGIDIAVDLKGYTQDSRPSIFSYRAAPIQINYLGYPGTMGASFMDYIIADKTVIPERSQKYYSEKVIYLPYSYQVNDNTRKISDQKMTRANVGLPEEGIVFCCFNNTYKITKEEFDIWMRLLAKVANSVLWLFQTNPLAVQNLRKEAQKREINPQRLVFAEQKPLAEHLARYRLADLFLDTFNYNAHTTASDALWAGLPVLTKTGDCFAARVGASLLGAIGLPELITTTKEEYEARALEIAQNPKILTSLKNKLANNKSTAPLFDTEVFTKHIERAFEKTYNQWFEGKEPDVINIDTLVTSVK